MREGRRQAKYAGHQVAVKHYFLTAERVGHATPEKRGADHAWKTNRRRQPFFPPVFVFAGRNAVLAAARSDVNAHRGCEERGCAQDRWPRNKKKMDRNETVLSSDIFFSSRDSAVHAEWICGERERERERHPAGVRARDMRQEIKCYYGIYRDLSRFCPRLSPTQHETEAHSVRTHYTPRTLCNRTRIAR